MRQIVERDNFLEDVGNAFIFHFWLKYGGRISRYSKTVNAKFPLASTAAGDPDHQKNVARLTESGAVLAMNRSFIQRVQEK